MGKDIQKTLTKRKLEQLYQYQKNQALKDNIRENKYIRYDTEVNSPRILQQS